MGHRYERDLGNAKVRRRGSKWQSSEDGGKTWSGNYSNYDSVTEKYGGGSKDYGKESRSSNYTSSYSGTTYSGSSGSYPNQPGPIGDSTLIKTIKIFAIFILWILGIVWGIILWAMWIILVICFCISQLSIGILMIVKWVIKHIINATEWVFLKSEFKKIPNFNKIILYITDFFKWD